MTLCSSLLNVFTIKISTIYGTNTAEPIPQEKNEMTNVRYVEITTAELI